jgi:hypothetical protein
MYLPGILPAGASPGRLKFKCLTSGYLITPAQDNVAAGVSTNHNEKAKRRILIKITDISKEIKTNTQYVFAYQAIKQQHPANTRCTANLTTG